MSSIESARDVGVGVVVGVAAAGVTTPQSRYAPGDRVRYEGRFGVVLRLQYGHGGTYYCYVRLDDGSMMVNRASWFKLCDAEPLLAEHEEAQP